MGRAYPPDARERVQVLLADGRSEEEIEKETQVSDRTIRRWKLEIERYGRIGKPPESRTGRHRVLTPEIEQALFDHVAANPHMSIDDMLWWLHEVYKIVVGGRTIRRVFERKNAQQRVDENLSFTPVPQEMVDTSGTVAYTSNAPYSFQTNTGTSYQSPYGPMPTTNLTNTDSVSAFTKDTTASSAASPTSTDPEDEATLLAQLSTLSSQKRTLERKLKHLRSSPPAKRDSRSKRKQAESHARTAERRTRMLAALASRSRKRDTLSSAWVKSKDTWPARASDLVTDAVFRYRAFVPGSGVGEDVIDAITREAYVLVDPEGWDEGCDGLLRERVRRKVTTVRRAVAGGEVVVPEWAREWGGQQATYDATDGHEEYVRHLAREGQAEADLMAREGGSSLEQDLQTAMAGAAQAMGP